MADVIPDDKAIKPSVVDEMARAIGQEMFDQDLGGDDEEVTYYLPRMARAAAYVVARRLRECMEKGAAMPFEREVAKGAMMLMYVSELLAELEGGT